MLSSHSHDRSGIGTAGRRLSLACLFLLLAAGCAPGEAASSSAGRDGADAQIPPNTLTAAEREAGWELLFDGESLDGWRGYHATEPPDGWTVEDGTIHRFAGGGDLMTEDEFSDFELTLEWKVADGGNSGIFYLAETGSENIFMSAPEMQLLDNEGHPNGESPLTSAGANYGLHPAPSDAANPAGEWNSARIGVEGAHVEHWLNGRKVVEYELGSPEWQELVENSKFAQWPEYGTAREGHIGLQDHGDPVWFRNLKIREIR